MRKVFCLAVHTKFVPASHAKGPRIKASYAGGSRTRGWDYSLDVCENHAGAARALQEDLNWSGVYVGGTLPDGSMCWVRE